LCLFCFDEQLTIECESLIDDFRVFGLINELKDEVGALLKGGQLATRDHEECGT